MAVLEALQLKTSPFVFSFAAKSTNYAFTSCAFYRARYKLEDAI
jgi:hypothetical protein